MGQSNGIRHILLSLVAGESEHHTLVACSDGLNLRVAHLILFGLQSLVHAHGNVCGLLVNGSDNAAGVAVKSVFCPVVANLPNGLPDNLLHVYIGLSGDLSHDHHNPCGHRGLTGHPAHGVLLQQCVQNRIGDRVAHLIRMSFCHGLRCK